MFFVTSVGFQDVPTERTGASESSSSSSDGDDGDDDDDREQQQLGQEDQQAIEAMRQLGLPANFSANAQRRQRTHQKERRRKRQHREQSSTVPKALRAFVRVLPTSGTWIVRSNIALTATAAPSAKDGTGGKDEAEEASTPESLAAWVNYYADMCETWQKECDGHELASTAVAVSALCVSAAEELLTNPSSHIALPDLAAASVLPLASTKPEALASCLYQMQLAILTAWSLASFTEADVSSVPLPVAIPGDDVDDDKGEPTGEQGSQHIFFDYDENDTTIVHTDSVAIGTAGEKKLFFFFHLKKEINKTIEYTSERDPEVPKYLAKYWHQRYLLFKRFDEGIRLDDGILILDDKSVL